MRSVCEGEGCEECVCELREVKTVKRVRAVRSVNPREV